MELISLKKRSAAEIEEIMNSASNGMSIPEICSRFNLSQTSFYRIAVATRTGKVSSKKSPSKQKIENLEKKVLQREREIALLRAALKKS